MVQWLRTTLQCRGHRFSPWSRKIPHAAGQPSPCATTTEARALEPEICRKRRCCSEKPVHHCRVAPLAATREKPSRKNEDLAQPQINKLKNTGKAVTICEGIWEGLLRWYIKLSDEYINIHFIILYITCML